MQLEAPPARSDPALEPSLRAALRLQVEVAGHAAVHGVRLDLRRSVGRQGQPHGAVRGVDRATALRGDAGQGDLDAAVDGRGIHRSLGVVDVDRAVDGGGRHLACDARHLHLPVDVLDLDARAAGDADDVVDAPAAAEQVCPRIACPHADAVVLAADLDPDVVEPPLVG